MDLVINLSVIISSQAICQGESGKDEFFFGAKKSEIHAFEKLLKVHGK